MRDPVRRTSLIESTKRLIPHLFSHGVEHFIIGHKALDVDIEITWSSGKREIYITQSEGLMWCLWSVNFTTYFDLEELLDINDFRRILWEEETITKDQFDAARNHMANNVKVFFPDLPMALEGILRFLDAKVLRRAELKTPPAQVLQARYFIYEVATPAIERLIIFSSLEDNIQSNDHTLDGLPILDLNFTNSAHFVQLMLDIRIYKEDPESFIWVLEQELDDSGEWAYLSNSRPDLNQTAVERHIQGIEKMGIIDPLESIDRELLITAFQALHRERVAAYKSVCTACDLSGKLAPEPALFGLEVVNQVLRTLGASPDR